MDGKLEEFLEHFPTEMLIEIFKYLNKSDITESVQFVCKRWLDATKHPRFKQKRTISFTTRPPPSDTLQLIKDMNIKVATVALNDPIFEFFTDELWQELGKTTETILFNRCTDMTEDHLIRILKFFPNLSTLGFGFRFPAISYNFHRIDESVVAMRNLEKIRFLDLTSHIWMDMSKAEQLVSRMPNLTHFGLLCLGITPVNDIIKVIKRRTSSIKSLSLRYCRTNNGTMLLEKLSALRDLKLEKFTFSISWISEKIVIDFLQKQNHLQTLHLGIAIAFPNEYFNCLNHLTNLKELNIDINDYQHTYHIVRRFFELPALRHLSIKSEKCYSGDCIGFHQALANVNLVHLRLSYWCIKCEQCWTEFCKSLTNLPSLSLPHSSLTDWNLSVIFEHMTKLRSLDLSKCDAITDNGMLGCVDRHEQKRQKLSQSKLKDLKGLKYLNLGNCSKLGDKTFLEIFEMLDLRTLNVSLLSLTLQGITSICSNFRSIETLQIYGIKTVNAESLTVILKSLPRLKELDISKYSSRDECESFNCDILNALVKHSQKLKILFAFQRQLLDTQVLYLFQNIPTLMSVNDQMRRNLKAAGELDSKLTTCPTKGEISIVDETFLRVLEATRDSNQDYLMGTINLNSFLL